MVRKCKYPDKDCKDRYYSQGINPKCRLDEWKRKKGTCPYDKTITSQPYKVKSMKNQTTLIKEEKKNGRL